LSIRLPFFVSRKQSKSETARLGAASQASATVAVSSGQVGRGAPEDR